MCLHLMEPHWIFWFENAENRFCENRSSDIEKLDKFSHMEVKQGMIFANSSNKLSEFEGGLADSPNF